jgi:hypothetical protein
MTNFAVQWTLPGKQPGNTAGSLGYFMNLSKVGNLSPVGQNSPAGVYESKKICTCESEGIP